MNTSTITNNIILDNIKDFYEYKSNWFNNSKKDVNIYSIFKLNLINSKYNDFVIYLGIQNKNNKLITHVFYSFYNIDNNIFKLNKLLFISNLNIFISEYLSYINKNNYNFLFNNFIKGIQNEH